MDVSELGRQYEYLRGIASTRRRASRTLCSVFLLGYALPVLIHSDSTQAVGCSSWISMTVLGLCMLLPVRKGEEDASADTVCVAWLLSPRSESIGGVLVIKTNKVRCI